MKDKQNPNQGNFFHAYKLGRDLRCQEKDKIGRPAIESVFIPDSTNFHALLMPAMYGPEVEILLGKGVPPENIWAVEIVPFVHANLLSRGFRSTPKPQRLEYAIDHIEANANAKFDLVYFDMYGVPDSSLRISLKKLLHLKMLNLPSTLLVTCGKTRCARVYSLANREASKNTGTFIPTQFFIKKLANGHYPVPQCEDHVYFTTEGKNKRISYQTTIARFGE